MKRIVILVVLALFVGIFLMYGCSKRNTFVDLSESVQEQLHQVETQYQRRMDLIPNIVATVKGQGDFEKSALEGVISARARATQVTIDPTKLNSQNIEQFQKVQGELSSAISRLLMVSEKYPDLQTNQGFSDLRVELEGCENRISVERMKYNNMVKQFNAAIRKIPGSLFAWGYEAAPYFTADKGAEKAPKVEF
jgi:LemA protein